MSKIDGTYSLVAASVAGCSIATVVLREQRLEGNDIAGSRYLGSFAVDSPGHHIFTLEMKFPPGVHGIFGSSESETFQTRTFAISVPDTVFTNDQTFHEPSYGMTILARRIPDAYAPLAGVNGIDHMIASLTNAKRNWEHERGTA